MSARQSNSLLKTVHFQLFYVLASLGRYGSLIIFCAFILSLNHNIKVSSSILFCIVMFILVAIATK